MRLSVDGMAHSDIAGCVASTGTTLEYDSPAFSLKILRDTEIHNFDSSK